jgi:hypothetical protein
MNYPPFKSCTRCKQSLPIESFYLSNRGYRHSYCKECHRMHAKIHAYEQYRKQVAA